MKPEANLELFQQILDSIYDLIPRVDRANSSNCTASISYIN
jgi:hypothetical protein